MINFYIPDLYTLSNLNHTFIDYMRQKPEKFFDCQIKAVYGAFPGMIWDGGRIMDRRLLTKHEWRSVIDSYNQNDISINFTCTNTALTANHLNDSYCNEIMKYANNGKNDIIIASDILENFIRSTYNKYGYVSSTTKCLTNASQLEEELKKDYDLVVPDISLNNKESLFNISKPEKCEILLNDSCGQNCVNRKIDYDRVSNRNLGNDVSGKLPCPFSYLKELSFYNLIKTSPACISVEDVYSKYATKGFIHFKIVGRKNSPLSVLESYIYYMVRNEYKLEVMSDFIKMFG